jgi:hypothetical protein
MMRVLATSRGTFSGHGETRFRLAPLGCPHQVSPGVVGRRRWRCCGPGRQADRHFSLDGGRAAGGAPGGAAGWDAAAIELAAARWRRLVWRSCWNGSMTGSRLLVARISWRRPGTGRWPRPCSGVTSCLLGRAAGVQAVGVSRAVLVKRLLGAAPGADAGLAVLHLVDCSLLTPAAPGPWPARHVMLETLRACGRDRLAGAGEQAGAGAGRGSRCGQPAGCARLQTTAGGWLDAASGWMLRMPFALGAGLGAGA